ncbi:response regulator [Nitratifractor sp.]
MGSWVYIVAGLIIIGIIALLLLGRKEEEESTVSERTFKERNEAPEGQRMVTHEPVGESVGKTAKESLIEVFPAEEETAGTSKNEEQSHETKERALVLPEPMEEIPGIDRGDFSRFSDKHVLIVEDNKINQKLILALLSDSQMRLDTAEDGMEALEKLRAPGAHYDLVLMDVNMPRMDGLEATWEIRNDEKLKEIPVVALTASTTPEEVDSILKSGMNAYLDKPLVLGKLYRAFEIFMGEEKEGSGDAATPIPRVLQKTAAVDRNVLNLEEGLSRCNDDADLYAMLLEDFLVNYGEADRKVKNWAADKDFGAIRAMMVDLEGITGTLGMKKLSEVVIRIHRSIEEQAYALLPDYLDDFQRELEQVKREIRHYLSVR